ncbi:MAG: S8 family serine peptidase [candidate division Zixibacteria bacterium]|nr:S8 family serine peptidase [candidate division Zixibacteria bacterium]
MNRKIVSLTIALLASLAPYVAAGPTGDFVPEQMVCKVMPGYSVDSINQQYGTSVTRYLSHISAYLLETQPGQNAESLAAVIATDPQVVYCSANYLLDAPEAVQSSQPFLDAVPSTDPMTQTAATTLQLSSTQSVTTGDGVLVGVIDAGINLAHPTLQPAATSGYDFIANDSSAIDEEGGRGSGHGTFVAGVINLVAPDAHLIAYRVLDTTGRGDGFMIADALLTAVDQGCKVINLSIVMSGKHDVLDEAIEFARNQNVMVIAAAGNDSSEVELFPALDSYVLAVAAVDSLDQKSLYSNYHGKIDICAPGDSVYAPYLDSAYAWWDGTSFAAPFVAATAALIYAIKPTATWEEVRDALLNTTVNIDSQNPAYVGKLGQGRLDPLAAVQFIQQTCCVGTTGNLDGVGTVDLSDLSLLIAYITMSNVRPTCRAEWNLNSQGAIDLTDLSIMIAYVTGSLSQLPLCP